LSTFFSFLSIYPFSFFPHLRPMSSIFRSPSLVREFRYPPTWNFSFEYPRNPHTSGEPSLLSIPMQRHFHPLTVFSRIRQPPPPKHSFSTLLSFSVLPFSLIRRERNTQPSLQFVFEPFLQFVSWSRFSFSPFPLLDRMPSFSSSSDFSFYLVNPRQD